MTHTATAGKPDPEETAAQLAGITGALSLIATSCHHDSGPNLWDALAYLSGQLSDVNEAVATLLGQEEN